MDVFVGTIMAVGFTYAPRGWAFCNGQILAIAQNQALFSLLGTTYGGNGTNTFALPDLRGRVIVGAQGDGPGITPVALGEKAGSNTVTVLASGAVTLTAANLPAHTHPATFNPAGLTGTTTLQASTGTAGTTTMPANGSTLSASPGGPASAAIYAPAGTATNPVNLGGTSTTIGGSGTVTVDANTGGGSPVPFNTTVQTSIMQPYTGINYIIALEGIFPSRN